MTQKITLNYCIQYSVNTVAGDDIQTLLANQNPLGCYTNP